MSHEHSNPPLPELIIEDEIANFLTVFRRIRPHQAGLELGSIDLYGETVYLNRGAGGDHIIYLNFDKRYDLDRRRERALARGNHSVANKLLANRERIGVLLADVSGHRLTDALVAAMLHQAFLTGVLYELDQFGEVTTRLFENLNTRFFNSTSVAKFITLIYGEISRSGTFRFLSAAHPRPLVFSAEFDRLVSISSDRTVTFYPLGMFPSEDDVDASRNLGGLRYKPRYTVNEVNLMGAGDVLLLLTDGLSDHAQGEDEYAPVHLERALRSAKAGSAREIYEAIRNDMLGFAPASDDFSLVVIKRRW